MSRILLLWIVAVALYLPACSQEPATFEEKLETLYSHTIPVIQPQQLKFELDRGEKIILLDTRSRTEYDVSHLKDAIYIDYEGFRKKDVKDLPKDVKIVTYCSVGYRSEKIGEQLKALGFETVYNLYGGIFEWVNQDYPIENKQAENTKKVHTYNEDWSKWLKKGEKIY